jgi:uncharacterized DUF497 family protein
MAAQFEWDAAKAADNVQNHRVSFEAATVFGDPLGRIFDDPDHSQAERRELLISHSTGNHVLVVSFTERAPIASSAHDEPRSVNAMTTKRTARTRKSTSRDLRGDYAFDYGKSRPNRFAGRMSGEVLAVVLEPDVARVFDSARRVNQALRSVIATMSHHTKKTGTARRKAG